MLHARRSPHDVARSNLTDCAALALHQAVSFREDEELVQWMRMPIAVSAGLERDPCTAEPRVAAALERRVDAHLTSKIARSAGGLSLPARVMVIGWDATAPLDRPGAYARTLSATATARW